MVTGFSGVTALKPPAGSKAEDYFFINTDANSLVVFDLQNMKGPEDARLVDAPRKFAVQAKQVGQVFGVALDDRPPAPNIYTTATSLYGLRIVNAQGKRVKKGGTGVKWMPGQFGPGGGPGSIWKIDGATGKVTLFANVTYENKPNSGPGLGNITFDPVSKHLFVSDLETGMVHRFDLNGKQIAVYDHGATHKAPYDPKRMPITNPAFSTEDFYWADWGRMVFGLAVNGGRLFYAAGENSQIWSVAINANGTFGRDARVEINLKDQDPIVTDITFGRDGTMYLGQRGAWLPAYDYNVMAEPQKSPVLAYRRKAAGGWEAAQEYPIGFPRAERNANGGVALGYGYDQRGVISYTACERMLWSTGELLRLNTQYASRLKPGGPEIVQGMQGSDVGVVRPANVPPFKSYFVDFDGKYTDAAFKGHMGDVAIYTACGQQAGPPPAPPAPPGQPDIQITKTCGPAVANKAACRVSLVNSGSTLPRAPIQVFDRSQPLVNGALQAAGIPVSFARNQQGVTCVNAQPANSLLCTVPAALLQPGKRVDLDMIVDLASVSSKAGWRVRNCVTMANKTVCAEFANELVIAKSGPPKCLAGGTCTFKITVRNTGRTAFDGPIMFAENMVIAGAPTAAIKIQSISPALGCQTAPTALPFACQARLVLPAGGVRTFSVTLRLPMSAMPPPGKTFTARNCFMAIDPAFATLVQKVPTNTWGGGILSLSVRSGLGFACSPVLIAPASAGPGPGPAPKPPRPKPIPVPNVGCPAGYYQRGNVCIPRPRPPSPGPNAECPDGYYLQAGQCVFIEDEFLCPDGSIGGPQECDPFVPPPDCAPGDDSDGDACVDPSIVCDALDDDTCAEPDPCADGSCEMNYDDDCPSGSVADGDVCVVLDDDAQPPPDQDDYQVLDEEYAIEDDVYQDDDVYQQPDDDNYDVQQDADYYQDDNDYQQEDDYQDNDSGYDDDYGDDDY